MFASLSQLVFIFLMNYLRVSWRLYASLPLNSSAVLQRNKVILCNPDGVGSQEI